MLELSKLVSIGFDELIKTLKKTSQYDYRFVKPFFDVINFVNGQEQVPLINGYALSQFHIDSRLSSVVWPESVKFEQDLNHPDLLYRSACDMPVVTPQEFERAQMYLLGRFKVDAKLDKSLQDVRVRTTLSSELTHNCLTEDGIVYNAQVRCILPLKVEDLLCEYSYSYINKDDMFKAQVERAVSVAVENIIKAL